MADDTYQGWTNRETWCVALWLNNEPQLYAGAIAAAKAVETFYAMNVENYARNALEDMVSGGWVADLVNCAMARVDWAELASTLREG